MTLLTDAQILAIYNNSSASQGQLYYDVHGNVFVGTEEGSLVFEKKAEISPFSSTNASYLVLGLTPALTDARRATGSSDITITDNGPNSTAIFSLTPTGVTAGQYGNATTVPKITVDFKGRITNVVNVPISGAPPSGIAGGDLGGTYPNPSVIRINGNPLGLTTPTSGNILIGDGAGWQTKTLIGDASLTAAGNFTLSTVNPDVGTFGNASNIPQVTVNGKGLITSVTTVPVFINALADPGSNGIVVRTGVNITLARTIQGTAARISVVNGTGVSGDPTIDLITTAVAAGSYGSATQVGSFTVDAYGRLTAAANITITGTSPGGAAGGDLSGTYPNPTVAKINTVPLGSTTATDKNLLIADGTQWVSRTAGGDLTITADTGTFTFATVNSNVGTFGNASNVAQITVNGKGLITTVTNVPVFINALADPGANGIVVRTALNTTTSRTIQGTATRISVTNGDGVASNPAIDLITTAVTAASYGSSTQVGTFTVDAYGRLTSASNVTISGTSPGGAAGGDLSGTYPNPTVSSINGVPLGSTTATDKNILIANGTQWVSRTVSGDLTITADTGTFTLVTVNANVGTFGSATQTVTLTANAKGLITAISQQTVTPAASSITGAQNVTAASTKITLGGTPTGATLQPFSIDVSEANININNLGGSPLAINKGGTNATTANAAFNNLSPLTTKGDLISFSTVNIRVAVGTDGQVLTADSTQTSGIKWATPTTGTVTSVSVVANNGITQSVATPTTTPVITLGLGAITPSSVAATGTVIGSNLSGTNTGDQTITLTGEATGSGTGSFAVTLSNAAVIGKVLTGYVSGAGTISATDSIFTAIEKLNGNTAALVTGVSSVNLLTGAVPLTGTTNRITISAANVFDISGAYVGQTSITTLGTISAGTWSSSATPIGVTSGGTNIVLYTVGDLLSANTTTSLSKIAAVAVGSIFVSQGVSTLPAWSTSLPTVIDGQYVLVNGTRALTGNWGAGAFSITANSAILGSAVNTIAGGTAVTGNLILSSTTNAAKGKINFGLSSYDEGNDILTVANATSKFIFQAYTAATSFMAIYPGGTPGTNNYLMVSDGNFTTFNAPNTSSGALAFRVANTTYSRFNLSGNGSITLERNVFVGGTTTPTAVLHLTAGTTALQPMRFTSGSLATSTNIIAGGVEFLTDKFYGTITTGPMQKEFTMNDSSLTSGRIPVATTNGRLNDFAALLYDNTTGLTLTDKNIILGTTTGTTIATATTQKLAFWGKTPIIQPASANQAALTNLTAGTYTTTMPAITTVGTNLLVAASTADVNTALGEIRNGLTDLFTLTDAMRTALVNTGIIKGSA